MANFTRTLSLLLKSGVKIVDSLETTANTLSNSVYQEELKSGYGNFRRWPNFPIFVKKTASLPYYAFPDD